MLSPIFGKPINHVRQQMHNKSVLDTGGLPYQLTLVIDRPYMITTNIDVSDGLANRAIAYLKYIEYDDALLIDQIDNTEPAVKRLWLDFAENSKIGRKTKLRAQNFVQRHNILKILVHIARRSATIHLNQNRTISAKRNHFPLIPACGMTIHKSQGGTFNEVVYKYDKSHDQQLVYVALSRVTSLVSLFVVSSTPNFHHGRRMACALLPLKTEFQRLTQNSFSTYQDQIIQSIY